MHALPRDVRRTVIGRVTAAVVVVVAGAVAGCGRPQADYSRVELVEVTGRVTLDGSPLAEATVVFRDPAGSFSWAVTDAEGRYRLKFDSVKEGVTPGRKTVLISSQPLSEEGFESADEKIPARYNRDSNLSVEVLNTAATHDFALTSD